MKRSLFTTLFVFLAALTLSAQPKHTIVFDNPTHELGTIQVSEKAYTVVFPFKNTGLLPLQIQVVSTPCVCTTAAWPKEEIAPGEAGEVTITYQATGPVDKLSYTFYVYSNGIPNPAVIRINGKVKGVN